MAVAIALLGTQAQADVKVETPSSTGLLYYHLDAQDIKHISEFVDEYVLPVIIPGKYVFDAIKKAEKNGNLETAKWYMLM